MRSRKRIENAVRKSFDPKIYNKTIIELLLDIRELNMIRFVPAGGIVMSRILNVNDKGVDVGSGLLQEMGKAKKGEGEIELKTVEEKEVEEAEEAGQAQGTQNTRGAGGGAPGAGRQLPRAGS